MGFFAFFHLPGMESIAFCKWSGCMMLQSHQPQLLHRVLLPQHRQGLVYALLTGTKSDFLHDIDIWWYHCGTESVLNVSVEFSFLWCFQEGGETGDTSAVEEKALFLHSWQMTRYGCLDMLTWTHDNESCKDFPFNGTMVGQMGCTVCACAGIPSCFCCTWAPANSPSFHTRARAHALHTYTRSTYGGNVH